MKMHYGRVVLALMVATTLTVSGCGGGGDAPPAKTFPLHAALDALTAKGARFILTADVTGAGATRAVDGDCSGTFEELDAPAQPDPLNSAVLSSAITVKFGALTCPTSTNTSAVTVTETAYFDTAYVPQSALDSAGKYGVYKTAPVIPATVKVGDKGTIGRMDFQTSISVSTDAGYSDWTYSIEPDSDTTAIAVSISKQYAPAGTTPTNTSELRYRIDTQGNLSVVSLVLEAGTSRLVFRCLSSCALLP